MDVKSIQREIALWSKRDRFRLLTVIVAWLNTLEPHQRSIVSLAFMLQRLQGRPYINWYA